MFDRDYIEPLTNGILVTLQVTVLAAALGTAVAVVSGLAGQSAIGPVRWLNRVYVELFRGTSAIIQLYWAFFALPLFGVTISALEAGVYVLGLNMGAYGSEVVRSSVKGVARGQYEAATALSLSTFQRMRYVIFPQAIPAMLPPYGNLLIEMLKASALVSLITLSDLLFELQKLRTAGEGSALELFTLGLILYFILAQVIAGGVRTAEHFASRGFEGTR